MDLFAFPVINFIDIRYSILQRYIIANDVMFGRKSKTADFKYKVSILAFK